MVAKENLHTVHAFMDLVQHAENADKRFDLTDGEIKEVSPKYGRQQYSQHLHGDADLTFDDMLPGFKVSLRKIFSLIDR